MINIFLENPKCSLEICIKFAFVVIMAELINITKHNIYHKKLPVSSGEEWFGQF